MKRVKESIDKLVIPILLWYQNEKRQVFFIYALILTLVVATILDYYIVSSNYEEEWLSNIVVEFHGLIFDIILFGILFTIFEKRNEKKVRISIYKDDLDDLRLPFHDPKGVNRTILRLNRLKCFDLDLSNISISQFQISNWHIINNLGPNQILRNLNLEECKLEKSKFKRQNFLDCKMTLSICDDTIFDQCVFMGNTFIKVKTAMDTSFTNCEFKVNDYKDTPFVSSMIQFENVIKATGSEFVNCSFSNIKFPKSMDWEVLFKNCSFEKCYGLSWLKPGGDS